MATISMYKPGQPGSTTFVDQDAYRQNHYWQGWRSNDDPYTAATARTPGEVIQSNPITADLGSDFTAFGEITSTLRITLPALQQPVELELSCQIANIGAVSEWSIGFVPVTGLNVLLLKGGRRVAPAVLGTAGLGQLLILKETLLAPIAAGDWTIATQRETSTATGLRLKGNGIFSGYFKATVG
jgi:hypothetical protein